MSAEVKRGYQDVTGRSASTVVMPHSGGRDREREWHNALIKRYRIEVAASTSSVFSTLAAFPLDSVKTRMQTYQYRGFLDCVKHTYRTEALAGFFRGKFVKTNHCIFQPLSRLDATPSPINESAAS